MASPDDGSRYSLLNDALLRVEGDDGTRSNVTLPNLLARLSAGIPTELTALQAHQQHGWHAFVVQLAAIALRRAELTAPPHDERQWNSLLLEAAKADDAGAEAFALVVDDLAKPAFMQPPVPEGDLRNLKSEHTRPSAELDVLITSKNHDVKMDRVEHPTVEHWIYGLVTLQTMQGFLGAGNYGIARMNGGFASRPCVAYAPSESSTARFTRDLHVLLHAREDILNKGFAERGGLGLVWCAPWDGASSLPFAKLDPFFIEICRRVRLILRGGEIVALRGSSKTARVDANAANGNTGDAWTPVSRKDGKALTMSEQGFTYERVQDLLFGDWAPAPTGDPSKAVAPYWLGQVLVRGQGKTGGYHERWLPVPERARTFLAKPDSRTRLGMRAQQWVQFAKVARLNILKPALLNLLQGGPEKLSFDDDRAEPFLARLNLAIDGVFFSMLFEYVDSEPELADEAFARELLRLAEAELELAKTSVPTSSARRHRAIAYADRAFRGAASSRKDFPRVSSRRDEATPRQPEGERP